MASPQLTGVVDHPAHRVKLVITREDQCLSLVGHSQLIHLLFGFYIYKIMENPQPDIALAYLFPKVGNRVLTIIAWLITSMPLVALVERQEEALITLELGTHRYLTVAHGEMNHGTSPKSQ